MKNSQQLMDTHTIVYDWVMSLMQEHAVPSDGLPEDDLREFLPSDELEYSIEEDDS